MLTVIQAMLLTGEIACLVTDSITGLTMSDMSVVVVEMHPKMRGKLWAGGAKRGMMGV